MTRALRSRWVLSLIIAAATHAAAQEPYAQRIAEAIPRVEEAVGLPFKLPPRFAVRSREELARILDAMYSDDRAQRTLEAEQRVLRILGVIPDTLDWHALQIAILREQVVGFYDPATKVLFLEDEPDDPTLAIVIPHELVHALQDQYQDLDSLERLPGDDDRVMAARAALEGEATLVAFEIALGLGRDLPGSDEVIRESVEEDLEESPVLSSAPLFVRRLEVFPYVDGLAFVARLQRVRPGFAPLGADLPVSTAQIIHPSYYDVPRRVPPAITFAPDSGAELVYENGFGELGTRALLEQMLHDRKRAARASDGWSADRFALVSTRAGEALVWVALWDSDANAREFADAARRMAARRRPRTALSREGDVTRAESAERTITIWIGAIDGHPAVVYADAPAAAPDPLDRTRIHVRERDAAVP